MKGYRIVRQVPYVLNNTSKLLANTINISIHTSLRAFNRGYIQETLVCNGWVEHQSEINRSH